MRLLPTLLALLALSTAAASARPLDIHGRPLRAGAHARVATYLVRHGLLTPEQAACSAFVPAAHGSRRVEHLSIYQTTGTRRCPGPPQPPVYLFDVYVDLVSGVVDTTNGLEGELDTVL